jgi:hypothetical protein
VTASSVTPIDPATLPREDAGLDQRWPTTLDGVSTEEIADLAPKPLGPDFPLDGSAYDG